MIVLLDLDGTVWDSEPGIIAAMAHSLTSVGVTVPTESDLARHIGPPLRQMLSDVGVPTDSLDEAVRCYREYYIRQGVFEASLYPGILDALDALGSLHRLATATSKGEGPARQMLEHFDLIDRFEAIGAATMDETVTSKGAVLRRVLGLLGDPAPRDCVLIGDRHHDVAGAAALDIACVAVTWGYGSREELLEAGAASVVDRPADLLRAVASL